MTDSRGVLVANAVGSLGGLLPDEGGADAQVDLARAMVRASVQLPARAIQELTFIRIYAGVEGSALVEQLLRDKHHANAGALKLFSEGIKSLALFDHLKGFNLNLGGK